MKFKLGDRVRIVATREQLSNIYIDEWGPREGIISRVAHDSEHIYNDVLCPYGIYAGPNNTPPLYYYPEEYLAMATADSEELETYKKRVVDEILKARTREGLEHSVCYDGLQRLFDALDISWERPKTWVLELVNITEEQKQAIDELLTRQHPRIVKAWCD